MDFDSIKELDEKFNLIEKLPCGLIIGSDINFVEYCIDKCGTVYLIDIDQNVPPTLKSLQKENLNLKIFDQNIRQIDPSIFKGDKMGVVITNIALNLDGALGMLAPVKDYIKKGTKILLRVDSYGWKETDLKRSAKKMAELSKFTVLDFVKVYDNFYVLLENSEPEKTLDVIVLTK